jgi:serine/threonine protein kinase
MAAAKGRNLSLIIPSELHQESSTFPDFIERGDPFDSCCEVEHKNSGGHGVVFRVVLRDGSVKAVKVINAGSRQTAEILKALNEGEIGLRMKHPHLLPIEKVRYDGSRFFLVMDLVEPLTKENLPKSHKDRLALFQQLVSAAAHLYSMGILHRDIKVQNCGLDATRQLVLFDFGESCKVSDHYSSNCVGTALHMAPEALKNSQYSDKSEIWALMSFLIEILTGKPMILHLFSGALGSVAQIHVQLKIDLLTESPIPEVFKTDKSPVGLLLLQILQRGLAIDPAERLSFQELESHLQDLIALL